MSLRVHDPLVDVYQVAVAGKQQVQILDGLTDKERLHHIPGPRVERVVDVSQRCVSILYFRVPLDRLK